MSKILAILFLALLIAQPSLASDPDTLPPPHVVAIAALDYSQYSADLGWCLMVEWDLVPGADFYFIRVWSKKGMTPIAADGSPPKKASWKVTNDYGYSPENPGKVPICGLAEKQRVRFRLRAIDYDNFANQFGEPTAPFAVRLKKYGNAPVNPRFGVPTVEVFGSLR